MRSSIFKNEFVGLGFKFDQTLSISSDIIWFAKWLYYLGVRLQENLWILK